MTAPRCDLSPWQLPRERERDDPDPGRVHEVVDFDPRAAWIDLAGEDGGMCDDGIEDEDCGGDYAGRWDDA